MSETVHDSKTKILDATLRVVKAKGYTAARVEDICAAAGLTKGSFFHHFKSKEELALAAAEHWGATTGSLFARAAYHVPEDPLDRLLAYVDLRKALIRGELPDFTCFAGTTVQEVFETHPAIRDACGDTISGHAATLEADIEAAMAKYGVAGDPASLALFTQAAIQGGFVLAKAKQDPNLALAALDHLRRYLELLFRRKIMPEATMTTNTTRDEADILALLAGLRKAHFDKDGAAIAAAYAKDAVVCDLSPPLAHRGIDAKVKQAWLDTWIGPVVLETPPGTLTVDGDLAVHHGFTRMSGKTKMAPQGISFWLRDTIVLKHGGEGWKIAHIHSSVPFYMDGSLRPAFDLQP